MRLLICFGLATLLMLLGTPWPGMVERPAALPSMIRTILM